MMKHFRSCHPVLSRFIACFVFSYCAFPQCGGVRLTSLFDAQSMNGKFGSKHSVSPKTFLHNCNYCKWRAVSKSCFSVHPWLKKLKTEKSKNLISDVFLKYLLRNFWMWHDNRALMTVLALLILVHHSTHRESASKSLLESRVSSKPWNRHHPRNSMRCRLSVRLKNCTPCPLKKDVLLSRSLDWSSQTLCCWVKCFDGNPSRNVLRKLTKSTGPEGFPPKSLTSQACGHYMKVVKGFLKLVCHLPEADAFMVPWGTDSISQVIQDWHERNGIGIVMQNGAQSGLPCPGFQV